MLNKVLWFVEAGANEIFSGPITGEQFVRGKLGPVSRHIEEVLRELVEEQSIAILKGTSCDRSVVRFKALSLPDLSGFRSEVAGLVDRWIKHVSEEYSAATIGGNSHDYGWEITEEGEELPLYAYLASRIRDVDEDELNWAM